MNCQKLISLHHLCVLAGDAICLVTVIASMLPAWPHYERGLTLKAQQLKQRILCCTGKGKVRRHKSAPCGNARGPHAAVSQPQGQSLGLKHCLACCLPILLAVKPFKEEAMHAPPRHTPAHLRVASHSHQEQKPRSGSSSNLLYLCAEPHCMPGRLVKAVRRWMCCCNAGHSWRRL